MIRLLTAAAVAVLLSTPVMAQNVSPSDRYDPSVQNQGQGTYGSPGSSSSGSMSTNQGLSNQAPADCLPNDPRPACQTAQLPGQEPGTSNAPSGWSTERQPSSPGSMSGSGSSGTGSSPSGSSGSMDR